MANQIDSAISCEIRAECQGVHCNETLLAWYRRSPRIVFSADAHITRWRGMRDIGHADGSGPDAAVNSISRPLYHLIWHGGTKLEAIPRESMMTSSSHSVSSTVSGAGRGQKISRGQILICYRYHALLKHKLNKKPGQCRPDGMRSPGKACSGAAGWPSHVQLSPRCRYTRW